MDGGHLTMGAREAEVCPRAASERMRLRKVCMLPVKKKSKCRKRTRRAHHALRPVNLVPCPKCGKAKLPHCACAQCGYASSKVTIATRQEEE